MAETTAEKLVRLYSRRLLYYQAEASVLLGQAYTIEGRSLTRADLEKIKSGISSLTTEINELENGASVTVQGVIPSDL